MKEQTTTVNCPTCQTIIEWNEKYPQRPFCSKRCKDNDFIDWANEEHRLKGSSNFDDVFSEDLDKNFSH